MKLTFEQLDKFQFNDEYSEPINLNGVTCEVSPENCEAIHDTIDWITAAQELFPEEIREEYIDFYAGCYARVAEIDEDEQNTEESVLLASEQATKAIAKKFCEVLATLPEAV